MSKIDISLCASANRPRLWEDFFNSLKENKCNYEVIFVGDVIPEVDLPDNFKFYYSPVKPTQCWESAIRLSTGKYISITADDAEYIPGSLDGMVDFMNSQENIKTVGAFHTIENGTLITTDHNYKGKQMAPFFVFNREYYKYLGGADIRYIGGMWENDVIMRVYEDGGDVKICDTAIVSVDHLRKHNATSKSCEWHWKYSFPLLEEMWVDPERRKDKLIPFVDKDILLYSQGDKGDW